MERMEISSFSIEYNELQNAIITDCVVSEAYDISLGVDKTKKTANIKALWDTGATNHVFLKN